MHLSKLPTIFVKNGEERKAYFTVQARELAADGWVEKGKEKPVKSMKSTAKASAQKVSTTSVKTTATAEDKKDE